jgi:ribosomal protein L36
MGRNDKLIRRNDKFIGRNDKFIGRNDKFIGRNESNDKFIGRNDKFIGRKECVVDLIKDTMIQIFHSTLPIRAFQWLHGYIMNR